MKVLITGASGYLGSTLMHNLSNKHTVIGVVRSTSDNYRLNNVLNRIYVCDTQPEFIELISIFKPEIIINTVAVYGRESEDVSSLVKANILYPLMVLESAAKQNVKAVLHVGTSLNKNVSNYSFTKKMFIELAGLQDWSITKLINIEQEHFYGPGDAQSKFTTYLINNCLKGNDLNLSSGEQERDFIYILDVIAAYEKIMDNVDTFNEFEVIPVGSGCPVKIKELVKIVHGMINSSSVINYGAIPTRQNEVLNRRIDLSKLNRIGWKCKYSLESGISETIRHMSIDKG